MWYLVQVVEYLSIGALLSWILPESTPRWLALAAFALVSIGVFLLNYFVVMPRIARSSRAERRTDEPQS
jgi:hypothetical protein